MLVFACADFSLLLLLLLNNLCSGGEEKIYCWAVLIDWRERIKSVELGVVCSVVSGVVVKKEARSMVRAVRT